MPWVPITNTSVYLIEGTLRPILREDLTPLLREGPFAPWVPEGADENWVPVPTPARPWGEA